MKRDVRLVELHGRFRVLAEFKQVERHEAVALIRAINGYPPRPSTWVLTAAQVKTERGWRYVGPQTAAAMGVFCKQEALS